MAEAGGHSCLRWPNWLSDAASGPEQEVVEKGIWTVAVSIGFCTRNCNRDCYSTVSMQSHMWN